MLYKRPAHLGAVSIEILLLNITHTHHTKHQINRSLHIWPPTSFLTKNVKTKAVRM